MKYKFGNIVLKIEAPESINSYLQSEFKDLLTEENYDIKFEVVNDGEGYKCYTSQFKVRTDIKDNDILQVVCQPNLSERMKFGSYLPERVQKFLAPKYATVKEKIYLYFFYQILYSFLQVKLLQIDQSLFHASAIEVSEGKAILLCGKGGVGKSSTTSYLCKNIDGARFLTDDQCIITSGGQVFGNPFSIHIYPYNIDLIKPSIGIWENMLDKFQWKYRKILYGKSRVCRRISPDKLYTVTKDYKLPKKIRKIYFLNRCSADELNEEAMEKVDFVDRMNKVMKEELSNIPNVGACLGVDLKKIMENQEKVLGDLHDHTQVSLINIPKTYKGNEISKMIASQIEN